MDSTLARGAELGAGAKNLRLAGVCGQQVIVPGHNGVFTAFTSPLSLNNRALTHINTHSSGAVGRVQMVVITGGYKSPNVL